MTAECFAEFGGFYWNVIYNRNGQITEIYLLPFENCRMGIPDDSGFISQILYNPFFGTPEYTGKHDKYTKYYDVFNPAGVSAQQERQGPEKYKGQVFFFGTTSPLSRFYPINEAYSCKKWMKAEAGIADYYSDKIDHGFLNEFMLIMKGNPNEPSTNPDYANTHGEGQPATIAEEFDEVIATNFMTRGEKNNLMVHWVNNPEEAPTTLPFPTNGSTDLFVTIDNQATKKITVAWKVPGVLANIHEGVSLGGDANQIRVAVKLMQTRSKPKQRLLTDNYSKVLALMQKPYKEPITITPWNPYPELEVIADTIWEAMTVEERRKWIQDNTEIELIEGDEEALVDNPATVTRPTNKIPLAFPENVSKIVKKTLDYIDKMGVKCSGKGGLDVANQIVKNENMGLKQLKRIYNYLKKNNKYENSPFNEGCGVILYNMWGGKEMEKFLESKLQDVDRWLNE